VSNEAISYIDGWEQEVICGNEARLSDWIESAADPIGHGLVWLLNTLLNQREQYAMRIIRSTKPERVAELISSVDPSSVWHIAEMAKTLRLGVDDAWAKQVISHLDWEKLHALASSWPEHEPSFRIVRLFEALAWPAEARTLDLVEAFLPTARRKLAADPVEEFHYLRDLAWHVLRILDPLGVYSGKLAATKRHQKIGRELLGGLDLHELRDQPGREHARPHDQDPRLPQAVGAPALRDFQQVSYLIAFVAKCSPAKANRIVHLMDWSAIGLTIGEHWEHIPHEAEVLFGVAARSAESRKPILALLMEHLDRMEVMPARLALIAPELALKFVGLGRKIALAQFDHVEWQYGAFIVNLFAEHGADLLPTVLEQCIPTIAKTLGQRDASWYKEAAQMLEAMAEKAPASLQRALDEVELAGASVGWQAAWKARGTSRIAVSILLDAASGRSDELGAFARQFKGPRKRRDSKSIETS